ncbi:hypothetical protein D910_00414 [Dendroctonus ponderosae]|uniref:Uncharacterized protein n=1 Tax=Dendroctonus ponderosae TaxID=77166 RepID=U4TRU3_DENPD|nr:hypothetical protein D910_00414 [Dendroctonus ponderosae]
MMVAEAVAVNRQKKKFDALMDKLQGSSKTGPSPEENQRKIVVNLASKEVTAAAQSVLAKGGNFPIVPSRLPVEDIISNGESGIRLLPIQTAEPIKAETSRILQRSKPPKSNFTFSERKALKTLNEDKEILVLPADKGNATVVMSLLNYENKIKELLSSVCYVVEFWNLNLNFEMSPERKNECKRWKLATPENPIIQFI